MTTFAPGAFYRGRLIAPRVFSTTTQGGAVSWVVPAEVTEIIAKCWGAGGGAGVTDNSRGGDGGAGGYAQARLAVTPGETLTIFVPTGGTGSNTVRAGGGGGSWAGIFRSTTPLLVAAGGGGGGAGRDGNGGSGGAGGGTVGVTGAPNATNGGEGGTQSAGGDGGTGDSANASDGAQWAGGDSYGSTILGGRNGAAALLGAGAGEGGDSSTEGDRARGGGGGAGYYGGGGGGRGGDANNSPGHGGGGGSSYVTGTETVNTAGSGTTPPRTSDFSYIAGRGVGGTPSSSSSVRNGGAGLVVIQI